MIEQNKNKLDIGDTKPFAPVRYSGAMLSIVIPTLNAADRLGASLAALGDGAVSGLVHEVVIVDGDSADETAAIAEAAGAVVVTSDAGRGRQLRLGGERANGEWLLFLHADTVLAPGWRDEVQGFMAVPANRERAAAFHFALRDSGRAARRLEQIVAWRCRWFGLPYGDQGLLISSDFYRALGGFRPLPLMEDVDLVRRIGRRRLHHFGTPARTSAARYQQSGYLLRSSRNLACLSLFLLGVPAATVARLYG